MFFVATAPREGHVNVSPKGYADTFAIIDPLTVAYLDLTGSGAETAAHLRENGRITLMFCSFGRAPNIVRLHGTGRVVLPGEDGWAELAPLFPAHPGARAIIRVDVRRVSDSCGYSIPYMEPAGERPTLNDWTARKSPEQLAEYRVKKNTASIDGLPAFDPPTG
ncbi:pyridoxamine 5'-phosphate oxidase family protein [Actinomadura sp. PM05-2]|uniref:Pyridoxamine 5'-phosphate oxidase family protein n=2 Tax=Actinomadura parmotrematis TaxID=2864039 RepID=A0ABS7G4L1_9ACTN|nr:pyridoxamine 5'-phosphate oxidase family protein [Actinomadura parmotrematis]